MSEERPKPPTMTQAVKDLAKAIMAIDLATASEDPYLRNEIRFVKDRVANIYARIENHKGKP